MDESLPIMSQPMTLREWRAKYLMSGGTLAAAAGVSKKTLVDLEHGRRTATFRTIGRVLMALSKAAGRKVGAEEVAEFATAQSKRSRRKAPEKRETLDAHDAEAGGDADSTVCTYYALCVQWDLAKESREQAKKRLLQEYDALVDNILDDICEISRAREGCPTLFPR